jgi:hypothetical protein
VQTLENLANDLEAWVRRELPRYVKGDHHKSSHSSPAGSILGVQARPEAEELEISNILDSFQL